jgi:hypothetical protein
MMRALVIALLVALVTAAPATGAPPGWSVAPSLGLARSAGVALTLKSGKVLVIAGASACPNWCATTELFDPATGTWAPSAGMSNPRFLHAATVLANGKVLVTGGFTTTYYSPTAELYDPASDVWTATPNMPSGFMQHSVVALADGTAFVSSGGYAVYDSATDGWRSTKTFTPATFQNSATPLDDGRILIAGGVKSNASTADAWLYDPGTDTFAPTGPMAFARHRHTATRLRDGRVLVTGGASTQSGSRSSVEAYDPKTGRWTTLDGLAGARSEHAAVLLADGRVLVTDGIGTEAGPLAGTEIFDPTKNAWASAGALAMPRAYAMTVALPDGTALMIGGDSSSQPTTTVERWAPTTTVSAPAGRDLGTQAIGTAGDVVSLPIANTGASSLLIDGVLIEGDYAIAADRCSDTAVAPGDTCTVDVRFGPLAPGEREGVLRLKANTAQREHAIALRGTAVSLAATPEPPFVPLPAPPSPQPIPAPPSKPSAVVKLTFKNGYSTIGLSRARACRGRVTLELKRGTRLLVKRTVRLDRRCRYSTTFKVKRAKLGGAKKLTVVARFHGNRYLGRTTNRFTVAVP